MHPHDRARPTPSSTARPASTCRPATPARCGAAIERLLADPAEAARLGANGRRWVEQHADLDGYVAELAALVAPERRSVERAQDAGRDAADERVGRHRLGDDRAGGDDAAGADVHAGQDQRPGADPRAVADGDRPAIVCRGSAARGDRCRASSSAR